MKELLILILLISAFNGYSQGSEITEEQRITMVVNRFFEALEKKDTALLKSVAVPEGQIWRIYDDERPERANMRYVKDDVLTLNTLPEVKETALAFEIKIHHNVAVAWVPYEFRVEDEFSHCGIDVFTLFKMDGAWQIMSTAYSVEKGDCDELTGEN